MRKVLFMDTWDKGYRNFTRLNKEFNNQGFETLFIHTGSFLSKSTYTEKIVEGLVIRDIRYYNTLKLRKVIQIEKPDVIIILNLSFVFDRVIIKIAKLMNIKSVFLAHGILTDPSNVEKAEQELNVAVWKKLSRIFRKKNLLFLFNYIDSHAKTNKIITTVKTIVQIFKSPARFLIYPKFNEELDADLLLLYTQKDKELYTKMFLFPPKKIKVVGNPEISSFINNPIIEKKQYLDNINSSHVRNYVLYLDDGLVANKVWTDTEWYSFVLEINQIVRDDNYNLIIKLHPRSNYEEHKEFFESNNILAFTDIDFNNIIYHSSFVVSHYSTTINYALIYNKPVFSPRWGKSQHFRMNYPADIICYCNTKNDFSSNIKSFKPNVDKIGEYLNLNGIDVNIDSVKIIVNEVCKQVDR